jgi:TatD DNase family protein
MFIDSHCHLNFPELKGDLDAILQRMSQASVDQAVCICTKVEEADEVLHIAEQHNNLWASVGVHPDNEGVTEPSQDWLVQRSHHPRVVAIGETGLDYYRLNGRSVADMQWQRDRFATHIAAARAVDLPLVVHTRSASDDTMHMLRELGGYGSVDAVGTGESVVTGNGAAQPRARGVLHCFTESLEVAKAALDIGFYISFSGIITFKNAADLREVVAYVPNDRFLIETDSPYLAPAPHRGKTNTPAFVPLVAQQIAQCKHISVEEVGRLSSENFYRLFSKASVVAPVSLP